MRREEHKEEERREKKIRGKKDGLSTGPMSGKGRGRADVSANNSRMPLCGLCYFLSNDLYQLSTSFSRLSKVFNAHKVFA